MQEVGAPGAGKWFEPYVTYWGSDQPSRFARTMAQTIPIDKGVTKLLDIGCGSGIIGIYCLIKKEARSVTFNDLQASWIDTTRRNVDIKIREGTIQQAQVEFTKAGPFADPKVISTEVIAQHTLLAFNPPQLPTEYVVEKSLQSIENDPIEKAFRIGGPDGLNIVRNFLEWYAGVKTPKPDAVILLSSFLGRELINQTIASCGLREASREETAGVPLRPIFVKEKIDALSNEERDDKSLTPDGHGWWTKTLFTIRLKNS